MKYIDADRLKAEIEKRMHICDGIFERESDTYYQGKAVAYGELLPFIDSLPEETSCIYDTSKLTPTPSVNIEDVARVQFASHAHVFDRKRKAVFDWEQFKEVAGIFYGFGKRDSLQQEPIEKDEEIEKLIVCDIIEATIARINGGKKDEEKEENIMREKISYLRDLGLKNHDN